jgi:DNA polymerase/3'-5' exonuclease PolX
MTNEEVADQLREVADLLVLQEASPPCVIRFRHAADTVQALVEPLALLLRRAGIPALSELPGIDRALAAALNELVQTGRLVLLDRLRGTTDPVKLFQRVPGIGPRLARLV